MDSESELEIVHDYTTVKESRMHVKLKMESDSDTDTDCQDEMIDQDPADHVDIPEHMVSDAMFNTVGHSEEGKKALKRSGKLETGKKHLLKKKPQSQTPPRSKS